MEFPPRPSRHSTPSTRRTASPAATTRSASAGPSRYRTRAAAKRESAEPLTLPPLAPTEDVTDYAPNAEFEYTAHYLPSPPLSHYDDDGDDDVERPQGGTELALVHQEQERRRSEERGREVGVEGKKSEDADLHIDGDKLRRELQRIMDIRVFDAQGRELVTEAVVVSASRSGSPSKRARAGLDGGDVALSVSGPSNQAQQIEKEKGEEEVEEVEEEEEEFEPFDPLSYSEAEYSDREDIPERRSSIAWNILRALWTLATLPFRVLRFLEQSLVNGLIAVGDAPVRVLVFDPLLAPLRIAMLVERIAVRSIAFAELVVLRIVRLTVSSIIKASVETVVFVLKAPYLAVRLLFNTEEAFFKSVVLILRSAMILSYATIRTAIFIVADVPLYAIRILLSTASLAISTALNIESLLFATITSLISVSLTTLKNLTSASLYALTIPVTLTNVTARVLLLPFRVLMFIFSLIHTLTIVSLVAGMVGLWFGTDGFRDPTRLLAVARDVPKLGRMVGEVLWAMRGAPGQMGETLVDVGGGMTGKGTVTGEL